MKKYLFLTAVISLFVFTAAASAQDKTPDFSGKWTLDVSKSSLGDRNNIESQTMAITQNATDLTVDTATKRSAPPAGAPGAGGGRGMGGGGDGTVTYKLDGKGVESEMSGGQMGTMKVTTTAKFDGGKLTITRSTATPMGDRSTTEKWSIGSDGNLSIESQRPNRDGGMDTTKRVFTRN